MSQVAAAVPNVTPVERDSGFFAAARIVRRTGSYPVQRAIAVATMGGAIGLTLIVGIALTVALSMWVNKIAAGVVFLGMCLGLVFGLMPYVDRRLFGIRAAFAFLATEILVRGTTVPEKDTAGEAERYLTSQFGELGPVCDAHQDVRRMVGQFFRTFDKLDQVLPIDLGPVRNVFAWIVDRIAPFIADIAISQAVARGERDFTSSSKDAVALVAQNPRAILGTAAYAYFVQRTLGGIVGMIFFAIFGGIAFALASSSAGDAAAASGIAAEGATTIGLFAAVFAAIFVGGPLGALASWFVRTAWLEPIALTQLLVKYHATTAGQTVDPNVRARLDSAGSDMRKVGKLAGLLD